MSYTLPLVITTGEPSGISSEVLFKSWLHLKHTKIVFFVISNIKLLTIQKKILGMHNVDLVAIQSPKEAEKVFNKAIPIIDIPLKSDVFFGNPVASTAKFVISSIDKAIHYVINQEARAMVTLPIEKSVMQKGGFSAIGHTEYLAQKTHSTNPVMLFTSSSTSLKVVPLKTHISLVESINTLNKNEIVMVVKNIYQQLNLYFKTNVKTAILGLNPHAGENGLMGKEEIEIINPAITILKDLGLPVVGPIPADTAFTKTAQKNFDLIIGMYHDQVLAPFKALWFDTGVNVTLDLPFLRTSPDHGTAVDIAGKNIASPCSTIAAIEVAHSWSKKLKT